MKQFFLLFACLQPYLLYQQPKTPYYKTLSTPIGTSAISIHTLNVKTYNFNYPVYRLLPDTATNQLIVSVRQKDASGRLYAKGYHLTVKSNDSIVGIYEDTKLDLSLMGDFLLISNDKRSGRFNRELAYEQFEYPSKIIFPIQKNSSGLTYNPTFKIENEIGLNSINLRDGKVIWSAAIPSKYNWNSTAYLNDSVLVIAAGGLHAVNINTGLLWSYGVTTATVNNRPLTFSSFNHATIEHLEKPIHTSAGEELVSQISSNILKAEDAVYFAGKNKLIAVDRQGKLLWETDLSNMPASNSLLYSAGENIMLINLGIAYYGENIVIYGKPFVAFFNKQNGTLTSEKKLDNFTNITDVERLKDAWVLANRDHILQVGENMQVDTLIVLQEQKYGKFLEFINGDDYYVEKEGYYVPLNFINDNIIYFKSDHGKVFGLNKTYIEYEYHYSELFKLNTTVGGKKLLSQRDKSYLISENAELLHTFNTGEPATVLGNKLYFANERLLYIINLNELK